MDDNCREGEFGGIPVIEHFHNYNKNANFSQMPYYALSGWNQHHLTGLSRH